MVGEVVSNRYLHLTSNPHDYEIRLVPVGALAILRFRTAQYRPGQGAYCTEIPPGVVHLLQ